MRITLKDGKPDSWGEIGEYEFNTEGLPEDWLNFQIYDYIVIDGILNVKEKDLK